MKIIRNILFCAICLVVFCVPLHGKDAKIAPKEIGVYVKTNTGLKRILPNIVFDVEGVLYIESNSPSHFLLRDVEHFVIYGKYNIEVLTLNPMTYLGPSPLGKQRFLFGRNVDFELKKIGNDLYTLKPKGLLGRGYYSLWINDTAWDLVLD
ncbi:MAG: hypothetical protein KBB65_11570 [Syntrophorhabdaceae bacterium]|nr:hypothetical protein [Syntrophorhabdaceae bacterium]